MSDFLCVLCGGRVCWVRTVAPRKRRASESSVALQFDAMMSVINGAK